MSFERFEQSSLEDAVARPGMNDEERMAILRLQPRTIPPRYTAPSEGGEFGMLEAGPKDTYAVLADELFDMCQHLDEELGYTDPLHAERSIATERGKKDTLVYPTVRLGELSYGMLRTETETGTVYSFSRRDEGYESNGFSIVADNDQTILLPAVRSMLDVKDRSSDDAYYSQLFSAKKWLQDYSVNLGIGAEDQELTAADEKSTETQGELIEPWESGLEDDNTENDASRAVTSDEKALTPRAKVVRAIGTAMLIASIPSLAFNVAALAKDATRHVFNADGGCSDAQLIGASFVVGAANTLQKMAAYEPKLVLNLFEEGEPVCSNSRGRALDTDTYDQNIEMVGRYFSEWPKNAMKTLIGSEG